MREATRKRVEQEERHKAAKILLEDLRAGKRRVPSGFINKVIRATRDSNPESERYST
jgi:hypothetical protein